jgi:probable HAF family extracellular repeat protein
MTDLGTLGGHSSYAFAINEDRRVVGYSQTSGGSFNAFLLSPETDPSGQLIWNRDDDADGANDLMVDLGTLGGDRSVAVSINEFGEIAGTAAIDRRDSSDPSTGDLKHAFLLTPEDMDGDGEPEGWFRDDDGDGANDLMIDLGTLNPLKESGASDVNDAGQVIGSSWTWRCRRGCKLVGRGSFLWQDGTMYNLNDLTSTDMGLGSPRGINHAGEIVTDGGYILRPAASGP